MFLRSIGQIPSLSISETARISLWGQNTAAVYGAGSIDVAPTRSEGLQGFCLVMVIKVLVEMAYDP